MLLIFGAPGSGKSMQGQFLAARMSWRWLSAGQLLRDQKNPELLIAMQKGDMVDDSLINEIIAKSINTAGDIDKLILDGYPRTVDQAEFLLSLSDEIKRSVKAVIVLDVDKDEIMKRLSLRGRPDDNLESVGHRFEKYEANINPVLGYFETRGVGVLRINGQGTVGEVHDRLIQELKQRNLL